MADTILIDNAVRVTITHSDSAATASEAATAFVNLDDATRTDFNWKPIPETCDRIMVVIPLRRRITASGKSQESLSRLRREGSQKWQKRGNVRKIRALSPISPQSIPRFQA